MDVKTEISKSKSEILQKKISDCNGDQKKNFQNEIVFVFASTRCDT